MDSKKTFQGGVSATKKRDMFDELERYVSFLHKNWPTNGPVSTSQLAKAGFFYIGVNDIVQCFSCRGRISSWEHGDTAMGEHKRLYPKCKFVRGTDHRNVPYKDLVDESQNATAKESSAKLKALLSSSSSSSSSPPSRNAVIKTKDIVRVFKPLTLQDPKFSEPSSETLDIFKKEINRLLSFRTWPITSPYDRYDLAAAGFYCLNPTTVQCFACFGRISEWTFEANPRDVHKRLFPACPFISGHLTENRPLSTTEKDEAIKHFEAIMTKQIGTSAIFPRVSHVNRMTLCNPANGQKPQSFQHADFNVKYGKHPDFAYEQARLNTYHQWPRSHCQIPANLARAGFFATYNGDEVTCFYCGGGLKGWEKEDDPWEEHARWFPRCEWLLRQKSRGFVDMDRRKLKQAPVQPNVGIPADQTTPQLPAPLSESGAQTLFSAAASEKAANFRENYQRNKTESKKRQRPKKQKQKKQQTKKTKSLEERVEEAIQSDTAQFMIDMGHAEQIIRPVLRKRLESCGELYENSADLLRAIFDEKKSQETVAGTSAQPYALEGASEPPDHDAGMVEDSKKHSGESDVLLEELERLRERFLCKICLDKEVAILFLPCKHLLTCEDCASRIDICPMCREVVADRLFAYTTVFP